MSVMLHDPFLARTYRETVSLLEETRNLYIRDMGKRASQATLDDLCMTTEWLLVTSRLGAVMQWLLEQKALREGQRQGYRDRLLAAPPLATDPVCSGKTRYPDLDAPRALKSLLERSWNLYLRVCRLDARFRMAASPEFTDHPYPH